MEFNATSDNISRRPVLLVEKQDDQEKTTDLYTSEITNLRGRRDLDRMVVEFTTSYAIRAYHH
jgi:hypothetical protein